MISSRNSSRGRGQRTLDGRHALLALVGFFAVVFAANGIMIYKAQSTFGGLDTPDAYRKGLAYNERVAAAQAQARLGWHDRLAYLPETRRLRVELTDAVGGPVPGLALSARIQRPATDRFDQQIVLTQAGTGTYEADVSALDAGWWTVDLKAQRSASPDDDAVLYVSRRRLWIKP